MQFDSIRVITNDVPRLVQFYEQISGLPVRQYTEDFAELQTPTATLAIGSTRTLQFGGQHVARAAHNSSAILEFRVADVDADYQRLASVLGEAVVQPPRPCPGATVPCSSSTRTATWSTSMLPSRPRPGSATTAKRNPAGPLINGMTAARQRPAEPLQRT
ncbi:VOC family protein [Hymenobacter cellulosilyticus]|uniref:VOC domain-containing protein n=1 Tax=Hymenobacter cellulosilyticus TaxID=2932248 RepID=A0A8T9Q3S3_9BACT|nr:VOC family protein [Hymenobacter cellulosilyticus]UOQ70528.1 hypothetical protein MUN79_17600 [Hymenobacter cellulosilyticus]